MCFVFENVHSEVSQSSNGLSQYHSFGVILCPLKDILMLLLILCKLIDWFLYDGNLPFNELRAQLI